MQINYQQHQQASIAVSVHVFTHHADFGGHKVRQSVKPVNVGIEVIGPDAPPTSPILSIKVH